MVVAKKTSKKMFSLGIGSIVVSTFVILGIWMVQKQHQLSATRMRSEENGWTTYDDDWISFRHHPDWDVENWWSVGQLQISQAVEGNSSTFVRLQRVPHYIPLPNYTKLESYFIEHFSLEPSQLTQAKACTLDKYPCLRFISPGADDHWGYEKIAVDLGEKQGVVGIDVSDTWSPYSNMERTQSFVKAQQTYIEPFLTSIRFLTPDEFDQQVAPSAPPVISANWPTSTQSRYSFQYPPTWKVRETEKYDYPVVIVSPQKIDDDSAWQQTVQLIIGTTEVFSTSGALCGNEVQGECPGAGTAVYRDAFGRPQEISVTKKYARSLNPQEFLTDEFRYVFSAEVSDTYPVQRSVPVLGIYQTAQEKELFMEIISTLRIRKE